jgi:hypothetical protein
MKMVSEDTLQAVMRSRLEKVVADFQHEIDRIAETAVNKEPSEVAKELDVAARRLGLNFDEDKLELWSKMLSEGRAVRLEL